MSSMLCELLDIKRYFFVQRFTFRVIGIDITSQMKLWRRPWLTILTCFFTMTLMISMGHYSLKYLDETNKVTGALSPFLQCLLSIWKVWIFIYNRHDMAMLIKRIWMMTIKANKEELKIIRQENLRETALSRSYGFAVLATACAAVGIPLILYLYTYFYQPAIVLENSIEYLTAFQGSYLIDPKPLLNYFLICFWSICSVIFLTFGSVAMDTLFCWYVYNIAAQFRILCLKIRLAAQEHDDVILESSIRNCINAHQCLIDICRELNRVFNLLIFVEFTLNCLQVCFLTYQIGRGVAMENMLFLVLFLMAVAIQLLIYCYGGQRIQNESGCVADEIYCSFQWHQMSIRNRKLLLLSVLRAQNCCYLNGYFFVVDLRMFLLVYRNAASYVSLLWSLDE